MDKKTKILLAISSILAIILALNHTGYLNNIIRLFGDPQYLREFLEPYGIYAAFILIALLLLNNILWIIPGHALGVGGGLIFGPILGIFIVMIGTTLSTLIAVLISKKWGRPAVKSMVGEKKLEKYDHFTKSTDVWPFIIMIILPVIPDDATVYLAGLTNLSTKKLVIVLSLARLPGVISLVWFGEGVASANYPLMIAIAIIILIFSAAAIWKKDEIMQRMNQMVQE